MRRALAIIALAVRPFCSCGARGWSAGRAREKGGGWWGRAGCHWCTLALVSNQPLATWLVTFWLALPPCSLYPCPPPAGFNVESVEYKNISFTVWDVGGQDKVCVGWYEKGGGGNGFRRDLLPCRCSLFSPHAHGIGCC